MYLVTFHHWIYVALLRLLQTLNYREFRSVLYIFTKQHMENKIKKTAMQFFKVACQVNLARLYFAYAGQRAGKNLFYQENLDAAFNLPAPSLSS